MNLSENPLVKKLTSLCHSQIQTDGTLSVSIYSDESNTPECSHTWHGDGRRSIINWLCLIAIVAIPCILLRCLCHLCHQK